MTYQSAKEEEEEEEEGGGNEKINAEAAFQHLAQEVNM